MISLNNLEFESRKNAQGMIPLHAAVISGQNESIAKMEDVDVKDYLGWTALHHAAAYNNQKAIQILLEKGADPTITTPLQGTYQDILRIFHHETTCKVVKVAGKELQLFSDCYLSSVKIADYWRYRQPTLHLGFVKTFSLREKYEEYRRLNPTYLEIQKVEKDDRGNPLTLGFGVFAAEDIPAGTVVTEFVGEVFSLDPTFSNALTYPRDKTYVVENLDGAKVRNESAYINHGFPNLCDFSLVPCHGLPLRQVYISLEPIPKGTPICSNYFEASSSSQGTYFTPKEMRPEALEAFLSKNKVDAFIPLFQRYIDERLSLPFEELGVMLKLEYVLQMQNLWIPAVLLGLMKAAEMEQFCKDFREFRVQYLHMTSSFLAYMEVLMRIKRELPLLRRLEEHGINKELAYSLYNLTLDEQKSHLY